VTAIAITLLALDLPTPHGATVSAFWSSVRQNDLTYLAFLVSFITIASSWSDHHDAFKHIRRADARLRTLNMCWLLTIIIVPSATRLLTGNGNDSLTVHAFRWGFYALVQVLTSAALFAMVRHMISHHLQEPGTGQPDGSASNWRTYGPMLGFALSIPVFFATTYGWVLWIVVPLLGRRVFGRRRPAEPASLPGRNVSRLAWGGRGTTGSFNPLALVTLTLTLTGTWGDADG
jgi:uncharacterized membrane protein